MEFTNFNLAYAKRKDKSWISIEDLEEDFNEGEVDILCIKTYETTTNKKTYD